jgi:predicted anti-sigma-YlaC factor YlaD
MNQHLTEGQLRAALDGELDPQALEHLAACSDCRRRQSVLKAQAEKVAHRLDFLAASGQQAVPSAQSALRHFQARKLSQKENPIMKKIFASKAIRYAVIAVLVLTAIVSIPATRAWADQILNLFRVEQVTVVPVDFSGLKQLNGTLGQQVSDLVSGSITMKQKPAAPVVASNAADASQKAGFTVRLPQSATYSRLSVQGGAAFDFTIDRTKAQALIDEAGRSDLVLPQDIDGAVVSVTVPNSIQVDFGTCPDPTQSDSSQRGSMGRNFPDCVILSEIPSPTVNAPANVNVSQLAQMGLEFTGMTSDQAAAFTKSVDWTSTLVVPIPKNAATYEQVQVDGATGTLIQRPADDAPQFLLIWVKNGIVYAIGGLGSNSQQALDMANSMH